MHTCTRPAHPGSGRSHPPAQPPFPLPGPSLTSVCKWPPPAPPGPEGTGPCLARAQSAAGWARAPPSPTSCPHTGVAVHPLAVWRPQGGPRPTPGRHMATDRPSTSGSRDGSNPPSFSCTQVPPRTPSTGHLCVHAHVLHARATAQRASHPHPAATWTPVSALRERRMSVGSGGRRPACEPRASPQQRVDSGELTYLSLVPPPPPQERP